MHSLEKDLLYYFKGLYLAFRLNDKENPECLERKNEGPYLFTSRMKHIIIKGERA